MTDRVAGRVATVGIGGAAESTDARHSAATALAILLVLIELGQVVRSQFQLGDP